MGVCVVCVWGVYVSVCVGVVCEWCVWGGGCVRCVCVVCVGVCGACGGWVRGVWVCMCLCISVHNCCVHDLACL